MIHIIWWKKLIIQKKFVLDLLRVIIIGINYIEIICDNCIESNDNFYIAFYKILNNKNIKEFKEIQIDEKEH